MECNYGIHKGLYDMGEVVCEICNINIVEGKWIRELEPCCKDPKFIIEHYGKVC